MMGDNNATEFNTKNNIIFGYGSSIAGSNGIVLGTTSKATADNAVAVGTSSSAMGENSFAVNGGVAYKKDSIAIGNGSVANGEEGIAIGSHAVTNVDGVAIGSYSDASRNGSENGTYTGLDLSGANHSANDSTWNAVHGNVSIGTDGHTRQITGLAAGTKDTDAVNVAQLKAVNENITNINNGFDGRITKLSKDTNRGIASAIAIAGLHPLDYNPEHKFDIAASYGHYQNANAVALGGFYRPNEDVMVSFGVGFGNGNNAYNIGASYKIGSKGEIFNKQNKASLVVDLKEAKDQIKVLQEENAKLKEVIKEKLGVDLDAMK